MRQTDHKDHTAFFFGKAGSFTHEAALAARQNIATYLERTQHESLTPDDIAVKGEATRDGLQGLIELHTGAFFVVPISNSKLGDVYDFMPFYSHQMIDELPHEVVFVLCNLSGDPAHIRSIVTKNSAYQQVVDVLAQRGFSVRGTDGIGKPDDRSTAEAAEAASQDASIAAVCSPGACTQYHLKQIGEVLERRVTTFGIFHNESKPYCIRGRAQAQFPVLLRNANLFTGRVAGGGKPEFADLLNSKETLRVKWGVDPISRYLHLGHLACIYKMAHFVACGHEAYIILGTFTGRVGDPSGNLSARPRLDPSQLNDNAECLRRQIACVLGSHRVKFEQNTDLMSGLSLSKLLHWGHSIDYRLLMERSDFKQRLKTSRSLSLAEILYGLLQAHDTLVLSVDVEVGGLDQLHNCILMRDIMKLESRPPAFSVLVPLLPGTDGVAKMSAYLGNEIAITSPREVIRQKLLCVRQPGHIWQYLRALTDMGEETISELQVAYSNKSLPLDDMVAAMADAILDKLDPTLESIGTA